MTLPNLSQLNWLAILLGFVLFMAFGFLWYSPVLFGNSWRKLKNLSKEAIDNSKVAYTWSAIVTFLNVIILHTFIVWVQAKSFRAGALVGLLLGLFVAYTNYSAVYFAEPKNIDTNKKLFYIDNGYVIVTLVILGGILASIFGRMS